MGDGSGEDGRGLINCIKDNKLEKYFEFYNNFIPYNEYFEIILNCDIIMPLIHPCVLNYEKYKATKVSAAFNMAYSFIKPLLLYEDFAKHDEFKEFAIFYSFDNLGDILTAPEFISKIEKVKLKIINNKKFNINMQRQNLINFLRG